MQHKQKERERDFVTELKVYCAKEKLTALLQKLLIFGGCAVEMIGNRPPVIPVTSLQSPQSPASSRPSRPSHPGFSPSSHPASDRSRCCFQVGLSNTVAGWRGPAGGPGGPPAGRHFDCVRPPEQRKPENFDLTAQHIQPAR